MIQIHDTDANTDADPDPDTDTDADTDTDSDTGTMRSSIIMYIYIYIYTWLSAISRPGCTSLLLARILPVVLLSPLQVPGPWIQICA